VARQDETAEEAPLFCARCAAELEPGSGTFYQVTIEAVADPAGPRVSGEESAADLRRQIEQTLAQMQGLSAREAMDQVYRRLTLHLCVACFRRWIEDPTG
jgi:hypothetical protein